MGPARGLEALSVRHRQRVIRGKHPRTCGADDESDEEHGRYHTKGLPLGDAEPVGKPT